MRTDLSWFARLLCRLGIHRWMTDARYGFRSPPVPAFCYRCHKTRGGYGE